MVSPGGSKYREFRPRSASGERRATKLTKPGTRQGESPGRRPAYKVHTLTMEDSSNSHKSDEYPSRDVYNSGPNLYAAPEFTSN